MIKKLPDAEFEIMKAIWRMDEPITSPVLTDHLRIVLTERDWKPQTVMTMLVRLDQKGFLRSEKVGKERQYYSLISEEEYMTIEANSFASRFQRGGVGGLVKALIQDQNISDDDVEEIRKLLDEK